MPPFHDRASAVAWLLQRSDIRALPRAASRLCFSISLPASLRIACASDMLKHNLPG